MQHAVAVLTGSNPSQFVILPVKQFALKPPSLPSGIPSELLQRRPDIASAERHMAAANASIGVGGGSNFLVGGPANAYALQPISVQGQTGLNVAAGVAGIELEPVGFAHGGHRRHHLGHHRHG